MPRILEGCWNLIPVASTKNEGKRHQDADDAGSWGSAGRSKCTIHPKKRSKYLLWAVFVAVNTTVNRIRTV